MAAPPGLLEPVVVGPGRVGRALTRLAGPDAIVCRRDETLAQLLASQPPPPVATGGSGRRRQPILVATTNDALDQVIAGCPPDRRRDLVFLQNGMLLPLLQRRGLLEGEDSCTQALLYLSASEDGTLVDGGRTVATGRWADALAELLARGGVSCRTVGQAEFAALMVEKLLWASTYWLLSAGLGGLPVGEVAEQHGEAARELAGEMLPLAQAYLLTGGAGGGKVLPGAAEQVAALTVDSVTASMAAYSLSIPAAVPSRSMALAEFEWRNGWFLGRARTPAHLARLARAGVDV